MFDAPEEERVPIDGKWTKTQFKFKLKDKSVSFSYIYAVLRRLYKVFINLTGLTKTQALSISNITIMVPGILAPRV